MKLELYCFDCESYLPCRHAHYQQKVAAGFTIKDVRAWAKEKTRDVENILSANGRAKRTILLALHAEFSELAGEDKE